MSSRRRTKEEDKQGWVFGLYNSRPLESRNSKTPSLRGKRKNEIKKKFYFNRWILLLSFIFLVLWIPYVDINCVTQNGSTCENNSQYKDIISDASPLFLRIIPLFNSDKATSDLKSNPYVSNAEIDRGFLNIVTANITERTPYAIWSSAENQNNSILVDQKGIGYELSSKEDDSLIEIIDEVELNPELPSALVETDVLEYLLVMRDQNLLPGYLIKRGEITEAIREVTVVLTEVETSRDIALKLSTNRPLEHQLIDFRLTQDYLKGRGITAKVIDVRLETATSYR